MEFFSHFIKFILNNCCITPHCYMYIFITQSQNREHHKLPRITDLLGKNSEIHASFETILNHKIWYSIC